MFRCHEKLDFYLHRPIVEYLVIFLIIVDCILVTASLMLEIKIIEGKISVHHGNIHQIEIHTGNNITVKWEMLLSVKALSCFFTYWTVSMDTNVRNGYLFYKLFSEGMQNQVGTSFPLSCHLLPLLFIFDCY